MILIIPGHTKTAFHEYEMLAVQNSIVQNALLFIFLNKSFSVVLPPSIRDMIFEHGPAKVSNHESCAD